MMECLETKQLLSKTIATDNATTSPIVGCQFHRISFAISEQGHLLTVDPNLENVDHHVIDGVKQVVAYCSSKSQQECNFYLRTSTNKVYEITFDVSNEHPRKRAKMDKDVAQQQRQSVHLTAIASNVKHMLIHHGIVLISSASVQRLNKGVLQDTHDFYTADFKISCLQPVQNMHSSFVDFFSLQKSSGLIYGTRDGTVHWRDFESKLDTLLFSMEQDEHVMLIDVIQTSTTVDALVAVGEQGTIICYTQSDQGLHMRQFNLQSPVYAIDKVQDLQYIVSTGIGKVTFIDLNQTNDDLEATRMLLDMSKVRHVRVLDNDTFETISEKDNCIEFKRIEYKKTPITIENDAKAMQQLIEETLQELAHEEAMVKAMKIKEQELNDKLASTNCTVYALKSINAKRELGIGNTLASTGFEFSVRPITKSNSNENCSLNTTAYLRICIKSSRFLELEGWNLSIQLFPMDSIMVGETKLISVVGFEPYYENGVERHVIWERDIELDLVKQRLPAKVSTALIMAVDEDQKELVFPVSELILDDLHFARPCSSQIKTSIERRGLDEISARFMQSYQQQKLHDRTGRYHSFARLMQQTKNTTLLSQRNVHIRYTVSSLDDEQYRSILPSILSEGHSGDLKDFFHGNAEQALFTMTSYPGCPVVIHLSRVAPDMIDFSIQCTYAPALFKVESILLHRIHHLYMGDTKTAYSKLFRSLEASVLELQQAYQQADQEPDLWTQLKKTMDILYTVHSQEPIGCLTFI